MTSGSGQSRTTTGKRAMAMAATVGVRSDRDPRSLWRDRPGARRSLDPLRWRTRSAPPISQVFVGGRAPGPAGPPATAWARPRRNFRGVRAGRLLSADAVTSSAMTERPAPDLRRVDVGVSRPYRRFWAAHRWSACAPDRRSAAGHFAPRQYEPTCQDHQSHPHGRRNPQELVRAIPASRRVPTVIRLDRTEPTQ